MSKGPQHRRNAEECRALARTAQDEQHRQQLLKMAQAWDNFAYESERAERAKQQFNEEGSVVP
jgi:hypothetical protein